METKRVPGETGHYYGACQLGDAKGRQQWVHRIGADRIRSIQLLRADVMPIAQGFVDDMAVLKTGQLEAHRSGTDQAEIRARMKERGQRYLEEFELFLSARTDLLESAGMPQPAVMQLARQWVDEFLAETWARSQGDPHLPDDLLAALPDLVRVFYAPR
jgi:hypothetical protein